MVEPMAKVGPKPSVNQFFNSLATALGEQSIGIILSGTGSDGASGVRAIKAAGGITIAQLPESAKYDGMPRSSIKTGSVDLVLAPSEIGPAIERLLIQGENLNGLVNQLQGKDEYSQISNIVRVQAAFRLDDYKLTTVKRRIARRMAIVGVHNLTEYIAYMQSNREEALLLVRDTFIGVTSFFRDPEAFEALAGVIDLMVANFTGDIIRCWVPGCCTGEEVYSIAILLEEALIKANRPGLEYIIFASDMDDESLNRARTANYSTGELETVSKTRRESFMEPQVDGARIKKSIRNRVVFTRQNVIEDPPFSRLDLISCRNLLIYLNAPIQKQVIEIFHYSLNSGGYLFLGQSESIDRSGELFKTQDRGNHIYKRSDVSTTTLLPIVQNNLNLAGRRQDNRRNQTTTTDSISIRCLELLTQTYAPPSLVINSDDQIIHMQGEVKWFLNFPQGRVDMYLFDLVDSRFRVELRALVVRARREQKAVDGRMQKIEIANDAHFIIPCVMPLEPGQSSLMISFRRENPVSITLDAADDDLNVRENLIISELEQELANTRTHLNVVVEELETSNEELQSLNEELQSTNEELQSTNEELQTSNEELQSTNEELLTVNEELQVKTTELDVTASDLTNIKDSLTLPLLVIDRKLRITQYNLACKAILHDCEHIQGASLHTLSWKVDLPGIMNQVVDVIAGGPSNRQIVQCQFDCIFALHIMPYLWDKEECRGAVLIFEEITAQYKIENALRDSENKYRQVTESLPQLVWTCTPEGPCDYLSPQWVAYTGIAEAEQLEFGWLNQIHPLDREATINRWMETAALGKDFEIEFRIRRYDGIYRWFHTQAKPVRDNKGIIIKWFGSNTDIHSRKEMEDKLRSSERKFSLLTNNLIDCAIIFLDQKGCITHWNEGAQHMLGYSADEMVGQPVTSYFINEGQSGDVLEQILNESRLQRQIELQGWRKRKNGTRYFADEIFCANVDEEGELAGYSVISRDYTERRKYETEILQLKSHYQLLFHDSPDAYFIVSRNDGVILDCNKASEALLGTYREDLIGLQVNQLSPEIQPDGCPSTAFISGKANHAIKNGCQRFEWVLKRVDGLQFWAEVAVSPTALDDADVLFVAWRDISEHKRSELILQEEERRVRNILDAMPEAVLLVDVRGRVEHANCRVEQIFGLPYQSLSGLPINALLPSAKWPALDSIPHGWDIAEAFCSSAAECPLMAIDHAGKPIPVGVVCMPLQDGVDNKYVVAIADITERKAAESELRLAASVFNSTLDAIIIMNRSREIIKVNKAFEKILGYSASEVIANNLGVFESENHQSDFYHAIWEAIEQVGCWQGEVWFRHKQGKALPVWLSLSTLTDANGNADRYIATLYDISEQKISQERINYLAHFDVLTGLANRTLFMDRFEHALKKAKRQQSILAVLFIDLDNFKHVNDTYGHPAGDRLLCMIAERLKASTRASDTVGRLSGDEFMVLIEDAQSIASVRITAGNLLAKVTLPLQLDWGNFFVSASIGIALYPQDGDDIDTLFKNADLALYRSKEAGRNQLHFYNKQMSDIVSDRVTLQQDLHKALEAGRLEVHFQPVVLTESQCCIGAEALVRWNHEERGWIAPEKFIAIAEDNHLIHALGEWVLRTACKQMKEWQDKGFNLGYLAINVSGKQLMQSDFVALAKSVFAANNCAPAHFTFEMTESFVMRESEGAIAKLTALRDLGVGIAIDDFGTGYSSLSYLKRLPVTKLKLDRSFVRDIPADLNDVAISRAILKLADAVGLDVVAEGVETEDQSAFLQSEGCRFGQGYLYAKPMAAVEFELFLKKNHSELAAVH